METCRKTCWFSTWESGLEFMQKDQWARQGLHIFQKPMACGIRILFRYCSVMLEKDRPHNQSPVYWLTRAEATSWILTFKCSENRRISLILLQIKHVHRWICDFLKIYFRHDCVPRQQADKVVMSRVEKTSRIWSWPRSSREKSTKSEIAGWKLTLKVNECLAMKRCNLWQWHRKHFFEIESSIEEMQVDDL